MKRPLTLALSLLCYASLLCAGEIKPVTGTFINLAYQDVRNRYTNPAGVDMTSPELWAAKVAEMSDMGMEYLIFMAVANDGQAFYPSRLMPHHYPAGRKSPVEAIMDAAAERGMKVFMSTGWAENQDDNLRIPRIKQRQMDMMVELAELFGTHKAFYGWYLPVEDCLGPVLTDYAVEAVNALTERARELTPEAKILISPYGIFNSDFSHPNYARQIGRLKVDIIAYQDEVGCVRERFPLPRLRENWQKLAAIHSTLPIEMWANCENFTWERGTNDRTSALIPAAPERFRAQLEVASEAGVERIVSFMMCGIFDPKNSPYSLGQPDLANRAASEYMSWAKERNSLRVKAEQCLAISHCSEPQLVDGVVANEDSGHNGWIALPKGEHSFEMELAEASDNITLHLGALNYMPEGIGLPERIALYGSADGTSYTLLSVIQPYAWPNNRHDAWVKELRLEHKAERIKNLKIVLSCPSKCYIDELRLSGGTAE
ncbi:MAG: DUF4434 domain-containing protein [Tidjanibacter sp.]|nr:DUF4434 domain-containing protein [Tidjanibacter sp.]